MEWTPALLARYPFLEEASDRIGSSGLGIDELLFDRAFQGARRKGIERARNALVDGEIPPVAATGEGEAMSALLAYAACRMIVSAIDHPYAVRRLAVAEGKRLQAHLDSDADEIVRAIAAAFGIRCRGFDVALADYLRLAVALRDPDWKLVNQEVSGGFVRLDHRRLARLCQEAHRRRIEAELPLPVSKEVRRAFASEIDSLSKTVAERAKRFEVKAFGEVDLALLPPCMKNLLADLQAGVNVPHTGRFAITSFLHAIGMDAESIMKLFSTAPDFKESLTRYQVEHITGKSSGTEYTPPSCSTMQTYNICPLEERDDVCLHPSMHHPLTYYRWRMNDKKRAKREQAPEPREGEPAASPRESA